MIYMFFEKKKSITTDPLNFKHCYIVRRFALDFENWILFDSDVSATVKYVAVHTLGHKSTITKKGAKVTRRNKVGFEVQMKEAP